MFSGFVGCDCAYGCCAYGCGCGCGCGCWGIGLFLFLFLSTMSIMASILSCDLVCMFNLYTSDDIIAYNKQTN